MQLLIILFFISLILLQINISLSENQLNEIPVIFDNTKNINYFDLSSLDIYNQEIYIKITKHNEIIITSSKNSNLLLNDYLIHVDYINILSENLQEFLESKKKQVIIPIVDNEDIDTYDGKLLLGFVLVQPIYPKKLGFRRGELLFHTKSNEIANMLQNGMLIDDKYYQQEFQQLKQKHGGGQCITSKDCNQYKGQCRSNICICDNEIYTGLYCDVYNYIKDPNFTRYNKTMERVSSIVNDIIMISL